MASWPPTAGRPSSRRAPVGLIGLVRARSTAGPAAGAAPPPAAARARARIGVPARGGAHRAGGAPRATTRAALSGHDHLGSSSISVATGSAGSVPCSLRARRVSARAVAWPRATPPRRPSRSAAARAAHRRAPRRRARPPHGRSAGLLQDLPRDLLVVEVRVLRGVRVHLRPVDRDHPDLHQPRLRAQPQHLAEQARPAPPHGALRNRAIVA